MSSYFDEDLDFEVDQEYKGIRFCPECSNMLHPKDDCGKLAFECLTSGCGYEMAVEDNHSPIENLVSRKEFQKEKNVIIDGDFSLDPTMPRKQVECSKCGHNEAVFFISSDIEDTKIVLLNICCNTKCGHYWRNTVEENN